MDGPGPPEPDPSRAASTGGEPLGGRYVLHEVLGVGGMSTVHRAFDTRLEVFRAVKLLAPALARKRAVRQRLENEARVMARLSHPNIVTLFELGEDRDWLYLVMELVAGGSVMDRVTTAGALPPRVASQITLQVLAALELTHAHGVVHRDIKPHNVLLDAHGVAKVTDFGIARNDEHSGLTRTGTVMGTLAYMPPEQKLSSRRVDARSDLYAVGCTLYCLLTAREPFDLYAAQMDEALAQDFYGDVPPALSAVIGRATAFRVEDRYQGAAEMAAALREGMETLPADPPFPPLVPPWRLQQLGSVGTGTEATAASVTLALDQTPAPAVPRQEALPRSPPPALEPARPPDRRRLAFAVVAGLALVLALGTSGVLGLGVVLWTFGPRPAAPVSPAPHASAATPEAVAPPPPDAPPLPSPVPGADPAPVVAPTTSSRSDPTRTAAAPTPDPTPAVEVAPVPSPSVAEAPVPAPARPGGWRVEVTSSGKARADVLATLPADNEVVDRTNRPGRPHLIVKCSNGRPSVILRAGVRSVEPLLYESGIEVAFSEVVFDGTEKRKAANDPAVPNELRFTAGERAWVDEILSKPTFTFGYSPSSSPMVTARFTNGDLTELRTALETHCGF